MRKLIIEWSRKKGEVQEPEARFLYEFKKLTPKRCNADRNWFSYYDENREVLAELNIDLRHIYIDYDRLWSLFDDKYNSDHTEIQEAILKLLDIHFKNEETNPTNDSKTKKIIRQTYFGIAYFAPMRMG